MLKSSYTDTYIEAGVDEVGRGCLAGPVVAAAVILPKDFIHSELKDSKQLGATKRAELEIVIKENALAWAIAEASVSEIDTFNILNASILAMHRAIESLSLMPELLLIDGNCFKPYNFIPYHCIVKGDDKFLAIAAASVLAKNYRDQLMSQLAQDFPAYDWEHNVGYPTAKHRQAIQKHGISDWHRLSFKLGNAIEDGKSGIDTK
ncbi:MAG: ribonuclease HII [Microscillaceae bacterium]|jgi:ribonuclease HII|nr:ribonuclease HII [Microscillaceae bacterium]